MGWPPARCACRSSLSARRTAIVEGIAQNRGTGQTACWVALAVPGKGRPRLADNADVDARVIILLSRGTFCDGRRGGDKCQSTEEARQTARQVLGDIWRCRFLMVDRRLFVVVIDTIEGQVVVVHIIWEAIIIKRIFTCKSGWAQELQTADIFDTLDNKDTGTQDCLYAINSIGNHSRHISSQSILRVSSIIKLTIVLVRISMLRAEHVLALAAELLR
jgi:hypothetical protein